MFKLKFKQKMKPNFLLCLTLRRKNLEILVRISGFISNLTVHYVLLGQFDTRNVYSTDVDDLNLNLSIVKEVSRLSSQS